VANNLHKSRERETRLPFKNTLSPSPVIGYNFHSGKVHENSPFATVFIARKLEYAFSNDIPDFTTHYGKAPFSMRTVIPVLLALLLPAAVSGVSFAQDGWYTEGDFAPAVRAKITLTNPLDFDRKNCPVTIPHALLPIKDVMELSVIVVDPSLPGKPQPTKEEMTLGGGHLILGETNGHQLYDQYDDIDRDGIGDEFFFMTDLKANETKTLYLYYGFTQRGWNVHGSHGAIGSYARHLIPFWESANVGWKLWYPTDCDLYGKRKNVLMSPQLYINNWNGYAVPYDYGSDIMRVEDSFGAGGICLFEVPAQPDSASRPRFTAAKSEFKPARVWNGGQLADTRYAFEVVVNGPLRSMIKVKTMNWNTGAGSYELEQIYTAYAHQNYSTCRVKYTKFSPKNPGTAFGCGIRKIKGEYDYAREGNALVSIGNDEITSPDDPTGLSKLTVKYVGTGLIVKDSFRPRYQFVPARVGNHTFTIPVSKDRSYEYMLLAGWSEGEVLNTAEQFKEYVFKTAKEYNNPPIIKIGPVERKR
jgi:hypothetical protein